jgi:hypothetical protein
MANKHRKVWKVISQKMNSRKQTWPWTHKVSQRQTEN